MASVSRGPAGRLIRVLYDQLSHDTSRCLVWTPEKPAEFVGEGRPWLEALASWLGWPLPRPSPCTWPGWGPARHLLRTFPSGSGLPWSPCWMTEKALSPVQPCVPPGTVSTGNRVASREAMTYVYLTIQQGSKEQPGPFLGPQPSIVGCVWAHSPSPISEF